MNDQSIGRINHSECKHPNTTHEKHLCRLRKIAAQYDLVGVRLKPEPEATERWLDTASLGAVIESLDAAVANLTGYAGLNSAVVNLEVDGVNVEAKYDHGWSLSFGGRG